MTHSHVAIVGGGLAGLSAAVALLDAGVGVTLLERRARLGGATWSATRHGIEVDNGQHVFLRCCEEYLRFLHRIGAADRVFLQSRLEIPVLAPDRRPAMLVRARLPRPLHMLPSLARYRYLSARDRIRIATAARRLQQLDPDEPALDERTFGAWLAEERQSPRAVAAFWDLIVRPTLNMRTESASLALAAKVFRTGLLDHRNAADIGWASVPLAHLHAGPAEAVLTSAGARILLRARVLGVTAAGREPPCVHLKNGKIFADAVIVAVPHTAVADIMPEGSIDRGALQRLGTSPIVNLHVVYDRRVTDFPLAAAVDTPVQWVFDRTAASGLDRGQYLAVSLSAADGYLAMRTSELRRLFVPELSRLFPAARRARIERFFVSREPEATFRQAPGTRALRPAAVTRARGVFLAGAWTDTGWPATMEGAVRSGHAAAARVREWLAQRHTWRAEVA